MIQCIIKYIEIWLVFNSNILFCGQSKKMLQADCQFRVWGVHNNKDILDQFRLWVKSSPPLLSLHTQAEQLANDECRVIFIFPFSVLPIIPYYGDVFSVMNAEMLVCSLYWNCTEQHLLITTGLSVVKSQEFLTRLTSSSYYTKHSLKLVLFLKPKS